jgi:DNA-binding transcriptional LysR family regulator
MLPLVLMGAPCLFRQRALESLEAAGRPWRVAFTSSSLAGVWAAVAAGLGVTVRTSLGMPADLHALPRPTSARDGGRLPGLGPVKLRAHMTSAPTDAARQFFAVLLETMTEELGRAD